MPELALGTIAAVAASALFSAGLLLQAIEARALGETDAHPFAVLRRLLHRRRWQLGVLAMALGFAFHVSALLLAPLTVVQPSLAAGLLVLLAYSARTDPGEVGARAILGVVAITVGVVAVTLTSPERATLSASAGLLAVALGGLGLLTVAPQVAAILAGARPGSVGRLATLGAGAAYSLTGLTTKLVSDRVDAGDVLGITFWFGITAAVALLALADQTSALRHRAATQVGVVIYVMPVVIPVVLAPLLFGEGWGDTPGGGLVLVLAILAVTLGSALLASARGVSAADAPVVAR